MALDRTRLKALAEETPLDERGGPTAASELSALEAFRNKLISFQKDTQHMRSSPIRAVPGALSGRLKEALGGLGKELGDALEWVDETLVELKRSDKE